MPTTIKLTLVPFPNPKTLSPVTLPITSPISRRACSSSRPRILIVKCNNSGQREGSGGNLKDALAGMVDKQVGELLNREENRVLLDGLDKASQRVEMAKKELAEIEKQELEAKQMRDYINQLESQASEVAECQRQILEAGEMVEEAKRSLGLNVDGIEDGDAFLEKESEEIDRNEERVESVKAALISALVGTLAGLPISLTQATSSSELILPLTINFISCALFGVTFRYTIRRDLDNSQLKTGTSAAFGFVKGLAMLGSGPPLELNTGSFLSHAFDGAVYVSENLFLFVFASVGLDYCFKMKLLSPFPIKKSISR
ncbi:uncharacterized protein LOC115975229 [Quercus lobata]|uniref:Homer protein n=1 Tax=Quercus lobata TaxID=97700 RepID=A0A7N2QYV8_QUELO|nr:uncharacterized protein LOC115975229 [Quercus lobata]